MPKKYLRLVDYIPTAKYGHGEVVARLSDSSSQVWILPSLTKEWKRSRAGEDGDYQMVEVEQFAVFEVFEVVEE